MAQDRCGNALQRATNHHDVLAAFVVVVANDDHVAIAKERRMLCGPMRGAACVASLPKMPMRARLSASFSPSTTTTRRSGSARNSDSR